MAPPRGVTFPIPVDYTQVGPALAGITDELRMPMDYATQLSHSAVAFEREPMRVLMCGPQQMHGQSARFDAVCLQAAC